MNLSFAHRHLKVPCFNELELLDQGFSCGFEFETVVAIPGAQREDLAQAFACEFDQPVGAVCNVYAGHKRQGEADYTRWHFTRDGSIDPHQDDYEELSDNSRFLPVEVVSPVVSLLDSDDLLKRSFDLLKRVGAVTNESCGLHFTFSSESVTRDKFNPLVFLLLTSTLDQRDLRIVGRLGNHYCFPTLSLFSYAWERLRAFCGVSPLGREHILSASAARGALRLTGLAARHRHVSVNLVKFQSHGVIEYRGIGGDYLNSVSPSYVHAVMKEYMTCASLACNAEWIEANVDTLAYWTTMLDKGQIYTSRAAYKDQSLGGIPSELTVSYIGNGRYLNIADRLEEEDAPYAAFGDYVVCLELRRRSSRNVYIRLKLYTKDMYFVGSIPIGMDEYPFVNVENSELATTPEFSKFVGVLLYRICRADHNHLCSLLKPFFTSRTYRDYKSTWLPASRQAIASLQAALKANKHDVSYAPWSAALRQLQEYRRSYRRGCNRDKPTYELLKTLSYSYGRMAGDHIFDQLLDYSNEYPDAASVFGSFKSDLVSGVVPAVVITAVSGVPASQTLDTIKQYTKTDLTQEVADLLSNHDAATVASHIASKLYDRITRFFEVTDRKFISPSIELAYAYGDLWHIAMGVPDAKIKYSADELSDLSLAVADTFLETLAARLAALPSYMSQSSRSYSTSLGRVDAFASHFQLSILSCFFSALSSSDNSWSHPSRLSLMYHILRVFKCHECSMDSIKGNFNDRNVRRFREFLDAPASNSCPDLY